MELGHDDVISAAGDFAGRDPLTRLIHGDIPAGRKDILVLGGAGFLGSTLARLLIEDGHNVTVLDRFYYGQDALDSMRTCARLDVRTGDVRDEFLLERLMRGKDTVINLAAIVGDEACQIDPEATWEINVEAVRKTAVIAKRLGIERLIHASTCSTYGRNGGGLLKEDSSLVPLSLYAESKVESERVLLDETGGGMLPATCIFRFSTLFGLSRRPRFDLVVNTLTGHAWKNGRIRIFGGSQWRPLLHVGDAARAIIRALDREPGRIAGKIYNTGGSGLNLTIMDIGLKIKELLPGIEICVETESTDRRDYRVDFSKIREELGFDPRYTISNGIFELVHALDSTEEIDPEQPVYSNYKWLSRHPQLLESTAELVT